MTGLFTYGAALVNRICILCLGSKCYFFTPLPDISALWGKRYPHQHTNINYHSINFQTTRIWPNIRFFFCVCVFWREITSCLGRELFSISFRTVSMWMQQFALQFWITTYTTPECTVLNIYNSIIKLNRFFLIFFLVRYLISFARRVLIPMRIDSYMCIQ